LKPEKDTEKPSPDIGRGITWSQPQPPDHLSVVVLFVAGIVFVVTVVVVVVVVILFFFVSMP
jgi:hypothetical protein